MTRSGHPTPASAAVANIRYFNRDHPDLGIDAFLLSSLLARVPVDEFAGPQRLEFHLLILCLAGRGAHYIDFERCDWTPGTVLHVRPGQVQQFELQADMEALLILFTASFLSAELGGILLGSYRGTGGNRVQLDIGTDSHRRISHTFTEIVEEYGAIDASQVSARVLQHQLHVLLLQLHRLSGATASTLVPDAMRHVYYRLLAEVEVRYMQTRRVEDYAANLGYSAKTLARACIGVAGVPPKRLIGQRVILEAKRLLAHTRVGIKGIARELGFSEETNFVKFFKRMEGMPPSAFRAKYRVCRAVPTSRPPRRAQNDRA